MILEIRKASVWIRWARRWEISGSVSSRRVSASSPSAPIGVFSSWLTFATKSRRTSSRRRRSETSSMHGDHPEGPLAVVDALGPHDEGPPGRPVELEGALL